MVGIIFLPGKHNRASNTSPTNRDQPSIARTTLSAYANDKSSRVSGQLASVKDLYLVAHIIQTYQIPQSTLDQPVGITVQRVMNHVVGRVGFEDYSVEYARLYQVTLKLLEGNQFKEL